MNGIRTERRFGVTAQMTQRARQNLFKMRGDYEAWNDLLDVMEQACIEIESDLINTDVADRDAVLERHKLSKAAWVIFTRFQLKVDDEISQFLGVAEPVVPSLSREDAEIENIINPTNYLPEEDEENHQENYV